jgi:hypothetical protein
MKAFWLHYNKPKSRERGFNVLTVHYEGKCLQVTDIECAVPLKTRHRKKQPRCVFYGRGVVRLDGTKAIISKS